VAKGSSCLEKDHLREAVSVRVVLNSYWNLIVNQPMYLPILLLVSKDVFTYQKALKLGKKNTTI
jgi:hypothetical protein